MQTNWYRTPEGFEPVKIEHKGGFTADFHLYTTEDRFEWFLEIWGGSTKHPDLTYKMGEDEGFTVSTILGRREQNVPQWLMWVASQQMWPQTAKALAELAMEMFDQIFQ